MNQKALAGAALAIYINGEPFGIATGISWDSSAGRQAIYGIDSVTPFELAPGAQSIKANISCYRIRGDGGLEGRGVAAPDKKIALEKYIDILVLDRLTGLPILKINSAAVNSQRWSVNARGMLEGNFEIEGLDWENESMAPHG